MSKPDPDPAGGAGSDPDAKGLDARRKADRIAEQAGARARARTVSEGKVQPEAGGPEGLEPTRYGDWEKAGRCIDF